MDRQLFKSLLKRIQEPRRFIQVLLGPRQVGKTTLALAVAEAVEYPVHYVSADIATLQDLSWLQAQWEVARLKATPQLPALLIIDEIQKIQQWSAQVKALWDEDTRKGIKLIVLLLGSSPWLMQRGLTESLAGRFEIFPVTHWNFAEMQSGFDFSVEDYIYFGGYPGAAQVVDRRDVTRWSNYINDSLIETTLSRDILLMTQVNKPALLRRLFQLGCVYSGQILSYTKMLGQLQDAGNTTTLSHYLELLAGAWVLTGLEKYAIHTVRKRASSPKFQVFNTALISAQLGITFVQAREDKALWGRLVESCIGAHLLSATRQTPIELYYWREGNVEVDFILKWNDKVIAIEVKSSAKPASLSGLSQFAHSFKPHRILLVGEQGIGLEEFLLTPVERWFAD